jgi:hypothetical protein
VRPLLDKIPPLFQQHCATCLKIASAPFLAPGTAR